MENTLKKLLEEKINLGLLLLERLKQFEEVVGAYKLKRKLNTELQFLRKITDDDCIEKVKCSNLVHLEAIITAAEQVSESLVELDRAVVDDEGRRRRVDVVAGNGRAWIKVVARNAKSVNAALQGDTSYGSRSLLEQASQLNHAAQLCLYSPKVICVFTHEMPSELKNMFEENDIIIADTKTLKKVIDCDIEKPLPVNVLNLDVSTMIAYVSNLTNGGCNWIFKEDLLTQQAEWEAARPIKPILDQLFCGKILYCCDSAHSSFKEIVNTVAGPSEKLRADQLLSRLTILPNVSDGNSKLQLIGRIKERSRVIFEFGARLGAITVSANEGFIRSARQQGIEFIVYIHESRALTELKEKTAERCNRNSL